MGEFEDGEDIWSSFALSFLLPDSSLSALPNPDTNSDSSGTWHSILCHTIMQSYLQLPPMPRVEQSGMRLHCRRCDLSWWVHHGCGWTKVFHSEERPNQLV